MLLEKGQIIEVKEIVVTIISCCWTKDSLHEKCSGITEDDRFYDFLFNRKTGKVDKFGTGIDLIQIMRYMRSIS